MLQLLHQEHLDMFTTSSPQNLIVDSIWSEKFTYLRRVCQWHLPLHWCLEIQQVDRLIGDWLNWFATFLPTFAIPFGRICKWADHLLRRFRLSVSTVLSYVASNWSAEKPYTAFILCQNFFTLFVSAKVCWSVASTSRHWFYSSMNPFCVY